MRTIPVTSICGGLIVAALVAGATPASRQRAEPEPAASALAYATCEPLQVASGGSQILLQPWTSLAQPIGVVGNVAACSLGAVPSWGFNQMKVVQWDPLTLAPDPTTVALRSTWFNGTDNAYSLLRPRYTPPIVMRQIPHLADPPLETCALHFVNAENWNNKTIYYQSGGSATTPAAVRFGVWGEHQPIEDSHPLLSHSVCGGDDALQRLHIVQSVMTTTTALDTSESELIQRFRVPVRTTLRWIEIANKGSMGFRPAPGEIAILEAPQLEPQTTPSTDLVSAPLKYSYDSNVWSTHTDFDHVITLESGRDYWLTLRTNHQHRPYAREINGLESSDFLESIGPLYSRPGSSGSWSLRPNLALCFRLIGEPLGLVDVGRAAQSSASLRLTVSPNPARGAAFVSWSGGQGAVRFDVLDVRGRRVGGARGISSPQGRWTWSALRDGRALPAGVYFVRATDEARSSATQRVVLIR